MMMENTGVKHRTVKVKYLLLIGGYNPILISDWLFQVLVRVARLIFWLCTNQFVISLQ